MISKEDSILLSAEKLFAEKGFEGTSTREISKAANANISMIAYYFGSKEKLLERIFEYRMKESVNFATTLLQRQNISAWQKMELMIDRYVDRVIVLKDFYLLLQREKINLTNPAIVKIIESYRAEFLKMYRQVIDEGVKNKLFKNNAPLEFIHYTVTGTLFTSVNALQLKKISLNYTENEEQKFYKQLKKHLKTILKHLLEYEADM